MQRLFLFVAIVAITTLGCGRIALADAPSKRHLVYDFTVGVSSTQHFNSSQAGTGDNAIAGVVADKGQISVDYLGVESDGGLVVNVSEAAHATRTLAATTCVVYANTNVLCGSANVNPEEYSIIRTLSPKFFDATALDANRHWKVEVANAGVSIDFTAAPGANGVLSIDSKRVEKSVSGDLTNAEGKYTYEIARFLPTSIKEYTKMHQQSRPGAYADITIDLQATLTSDSLAAAH
jgi:hypothetical protein